MFVLVALVVLAFWCALLTLGLWTHNHVDNRKKNK